MPAKIKLLPLFLTDSLRGTGINVLTIFSSIFIYQTVYTLSTDLRFSLSVTSLFYALHNLVSFGSNFVAERTAQLVGLKKTLLAGQLLLITTIVSLNLAGEQAYLLLATAVIFGLASSFYWISWHSYLAKEGQSGKFGRELGILSLLGTTFSLAAPLLAGLAITNFGFGGLYLATIVLITLSLLPILALDNERLNHRAGVQSTLRLFWTHPRNFWAYFGNAINSSVGSVIFPLYLYLILKTELAVGGFFTLSGAAVALINLFVGKLTDSKGASLPLKIGAVSNFVVWIGRAFTTFPPLLLLTDTASKLTSGMTNIPLSVGTYEKAVDGHNTGQAILFQEASLHLGSLFIFLLIPVLLWCNASFLVIFLLTALFSLFPMFIAKVRVSENG